MEINPTVMGRAHRASRTTEWRSVFVAGSLAGILDLIFATSLWGFLGIPPQKVLQSIASGLFGASAFAGGLPMALAGLFLHFLIASLMALFYFRFAPAGMRRRPLLSGTAYGAGLWLVMNLVVVPLSAAPVSIPPTPIAIADFVCHVVLVGWPIAWLAYRADIPSALG